MFAGAYSATIRKGDESVKLGVSVGGISSILMKAVLACRGGQLVNAVENPFAEPKEITYDQP